MYWLALVLLACFSGAKDSDATWDFDRDEPGKKPKGFYFDDTGRAPDGKWRVVQEDGNRVLAQLDRSRDRGRYALAVVSGSSYQHLRLSARIKAVQGDIDQAGGLVWRYRNSENYLVARLDVSERNVRLYRFVRGNRIQFGVEKDLDIKLGQWYTLRVEHRGRLVKVYLDDEMLFDKWDRHFTRPGKIGLWTKADSVMHFDDVRVAKLKDRRRDD